MSGEFLALCNASIVHRFTSPSWYNTLRQYLVTAHGRKDDQSLFREITGLNTGQALVFCPTAILDVNPETGKPKLLRDEYFKLAVRSRVSADGGKSILPKYQARSADEPHSDDITSISSTSISNNSEDGPRTLRHGTSPAAMIYGSRSWTESELEDAIYNQIQALLGANPVKDPWPVVVWPAFKALEREYGLPERFFADNKLGPDCRDQWPTDMMRRLLKRYYDELMIPREHRAARRWLRD